ncbi:Transcription factor TFIIB [Corchorus capsularis]|uniref:Exocyst subunit Exo70 family protein n=1 Tax=Corchorus capsularis TaxID=210143 RepID=A0A1R3HS52_COCAP|nr:Transcription factor TFIIB [Corchorus capsularis]
MAADNFCLQCEKPTGIIIDHEAGERICSECGCSLLESSMEIDSAESETLLQSDSTEELETDPNPVFDFENYSTIPNNIPNQASDDHKIVKKPRRGYKLIGIMADRLGQISEIKDKDRAEIKDRAREIYNKVNDFKTCRGRSLNSILAACLFIACRELELPSTLKELSDVANKVPKKDINRAVECIKSKLVVETGGGVQPKQLVKRYCAKLGMQEKDIKAVLYAQNKSEELDIRRSPKSVVAAIIYMIIQLSDHQVHIKDIAMATEVTELTIRKSYKEVYRHALKLIPAWDQLQNLTRGRRREYEFLALNWKGEENLIAAANHVLRALGFNDKYLTQDVKKTGQLSNMATIDDNVVEDEKSEIEEQLSIVHEEILSWVVDESMTWCSGPDEVAEYLTAADEARKLTERLKDQCLNSEEDKELLRRAHDVLQMAMLRLEKEFKHILLQHKRPFEFELMSFCSSEDDAVDEGSRVSFGDDSFEEPAHRDSISRTSEEYIIDLVHPDVIPDLKCIANLMFMSNYDHECCQAYVNVRKEALDDCLFNLELEKLSIEDVHKMEWGILSFKIKRWVRTINFLVRLYLASEKWLCNQIFADLGSTSLVYFVEATKASMLQLLNFAEAISIGSHQPQKLVRILDMYEVLADLVPDIDALFSDGAGSSILTEHHEVLKSLGDSVRAVFVEFEKAIASNASTNPFAGGGIHPLTRYVMNYIRLLAAHDDTLNILLKNQDGVAASPLSPDTSPATEDNSISSCSPMALHFQSLTSILEVNLYGKSKLYRDASLQHFFLMNNIHHMAQKVKNSELRLMFGDEWIRKHNWKFQQHAMNYERATWSSTLSLLKDESIGGSGPKALLKKRLQSFYVAFEEVYKTQTAWIISDVQLREDLRISTSLKVFPAYRSFVKRFGHDIGEKHIRYNAEDLQDYLLDLFEGSQKSLHSPRRR